MAEFSLHRGTQSQQHKALEYDFIALVVRSWQCPLNPGGLLNLDQTFVYFLIRLSETEKAFIFLFNLTFS